MEITYTDYWNIEINSSEKKMLLAALRKYLKYKKGQSRENVLDLIDTIKYCDEDGCDPFSPSKYD